MSSPSELYQAGKLDEAVQAILELVKKNPTKTALRFQLAEFSCVAGDLERAERQLDTVSTQDPGTAVGSALFRQLIRAELARRECFSQGRVPEFLGEPSTQVANHLRALAALREDDQNDASEIIAGGTIDDNSGATGWIVNDVTVDEIRDLDDLLAPILEVHTSTGKYFWVDWKQIVSMEVHPPARPVDLIWRQATLSIKDGPDGEVYLPAIYIDPPGIEPADSNLRMGRSTDWIDVTESLVRGRGQKTLLVGEEDMPIMELKTIERPE